MGDLHRKCARLRKRSGPSGSARRNYSYAADELVNRWNNRRRGLLRLQPAR